MKVLSTKKLFITLFLSAAVPFVMQAKVTLENDTQNRISYHVKYYPIAIHFKYVQCKSFMGSLRSGKSVEIERYFKVKKLEVQPLSYSISVASADTDIKLVYGMVNGKLKIYKK